MPDMPTHAAAKPRALLSQKDWTATEMGPSAQWPDTLKVVLDLLFASHQPKVLLWGERRRAFYNAAYLLLFGTKFQGSIGDPYEELHPDLWPLVKEHFAAAGKGETPDLRHIGIDPDPDGVGSLLRFTLSCVPVRTPSGDVAGVLATIVDTPDALDLKEKAKGENHRLRELLQQAPGYVAILDGPEHCYAFANDSYYDLVGHQAIIGKTVADLVPETFGQGLLEVLEKVFRTGESHVGAPEPVRLTDGSGSVRERYLTFLFQPFRDETGDVKGVISIGHDVSEEVMVRAEANRLRAELIHVSRVSAMGTMATSLAHELNQPLAAAGSYLAGVERLLRNSAGDDEILQGVSEAKRQVQRAGGIIRRVRQLVAGKQRDVHLVLLSEALNEVISLLRATDEWAGFEISCQIGSGAEIVEADQIQLEQVFLNMIRNALQAASAKTIPEVRVSASREADNITILVSDNGPGFGDRDPDSLFSGFSSEKPGGLGIGLSISRTIIEAHGGSISASCGPAGACFVVSLPAPSTGQDRSDMVVQRC